MRSGARGGSQTAIDDCPFMWLSGLLETRNARHCSRWEFHVIEGLLPRSSCRLWGTSSRIYCPDRIDRSVRSSGSSRCKGDSLSVLRIWESMTGGICDGRCSAAQVCCQEKENLIRKKGSHVQYDGRWELRNQTGQGKRSKPLFVHIIVLCN